MRCLGPDALRHRLVGDGLLLKTGPFVTRIRSRIPSVAAGLASVYRDYPVHEPGGFHDFDCELRAPRTLRRFYHPQVLFLSDRRSVFKPLAFHQAYPMLEWGMNWCITSLVQHRLVLHAAALEREGRALLLPAPPGSGKSTLCAALSHNGWRLLTDESVLLDVDAGTVSGPARPVSLKNASIEVIRDFCPEARLNPPVHDTLKGTVSHMSPPRGAVERAGAPASPAWVVFPRYCKGAQARFTERSPGACLVGLIDNTFNYAALGARAFHGLGALSDRVRAFDFVYGDLAEAMTVFDELAHGR
ncbi:HprK-related kinase A [Thioalkalivibrio sp. ALJT]|uniref:HprK-related kinase A n=1 Tax=Thioalkalivibrio sp. ALJT TaxID=1158146 RepID=UPI000376AA06|nr:HprK-related kinase A [Thioalkalivibrio sp. ALJT]